MPGRPVLVYAGAGDVVDGEDYMINQFRFRPGWWLWLLALSVIMGCSKMGGGGVDIDDDGEEDDTTPPSAVVDLHAANVGITEATICWTAPGDDGDSGYAFQYDLRASLDSITTANFAQAYKIDSTDPPYPPGVAQCYTLDSLEAGQMYYFALKTSDYEGNWSGMSNCISLQCQIDSIVNFPDTALERVVRAAISKPTGDIKRSDLQSLTELWAEDEHITDLSGVQYCRQLVFLHASFNTISDLTPLQGITSLRVLALLRNQITDVSALAGLTDLEQLHLAQNPITNLAPLAGLTKLKYMSIHSIQTNDFSPISGMTALEELNIGNNPTGNFAAIANLTALKRLTMDFCGLTDLSVLQNLTGLTHLYLPYNQISDLTPLSSLVNINILDLSINSISDILPLVNNPGLANGDILKLQNNPSLSTQSKDVYIPALQARGVTVTW